jgi:hypothetical protein
MKRFVIKALFFVIILYVLALLVQSFIDKGAGKTGLSNYTEWNDIVESKINADLLIQGSSKAWVQISPQILDSAFHLNSYNLGIDGYFFSMQYARFLFYLKYNKKPKYIIQVVDCNSLAMNSDLYMFEQFIPYLGSPIIQNAVSYQDVFDYKDFYIPMFKYLHSYASREIMDSAIKANLINRTVRNWKYKGFMASDQKWDNSFREFKKNFANGYTSFVDSLTRKRFEMFLSYCKNEQIKVALVLPPEFIEAQKLLLNRDAIISIFREYSEKFDTPFLDYSNDSLCLDTTNFYNSQHLNRIGVAKFNKKLSTDLKSYFKE